ncbi:hypothetical protein [Amycolatopsis sp. NBC_00438]|uniref:hypothetical protein n=1 Tax=unclassified Amycolatopsis TaxID=2618356 RepID=UPI002E22DCCE
MLEPQGQLADDGVPEALAPLLEPDVVLDADPGECGDLLPPQPGDPTAGAALLLLRQRS